MSYNRNAGRGPKKIPPNYRDTIVSRLEEAWGTDRLPLTVWQYAAVLLVLFPEDYEEGEAPDVGLAQEADDPSTRGHGYLDEDLD